MINNFNIRKHLKYPLAILFVCGCASCASDSLDEPTLNPYQPYVAPAYIEICGGTPLGLPMTTRADIGDEQTSDSNEPSTHGFCNADVIDILAYTHVQSYMNAYEDNITKLESTTHLPITHYDGINNVNKWIIYNFKFQPSDVKYYYGFSIPAFAYKESNKNLFDLKSKEIDDNRSSLTLELNQSEKTPELYFGNLTMDIDEGESTKYFRNNGAEEFFFKFKYRPQTLQWPLQGKLYRIVSQLNLNLSEVDERVVERLELMLENVPKTLKLYGNHGAYYPVGVTDEVFKNSAEGELTDVYIKVAEADASAIRDGKVKLSTFLLPSKVGRKISLRVHYKKGARIDEETGKEILVKDYPIEPASDVCLTETTSMVYYGLDATGNKSYDYDEEKDYPKLSEDKSKICVYDSETKFFYSYSNIRVNINTKFAILCPN